MNGNSSQHENDGRIKPGIRKTIWDDLHRKDLGKNIRRDFDDLYEFFIDKETQKRLASKGRVKRFFSTGFQLFRVLILRLSPTRRILLVLSIIVMWLGNSTIQFDSSNISFHFSIFGFILILLILMLELKDKLLARSELEAGRVVQSALMPKENPVLSGWSIWLFSRPANDVGGDLVDSIPLSDNRLGIALGDIAGKGLGAALLMSKLQSTLRALAPYFPSLSELGTRLNEIFCRDSIPSRFASLAYLEISSDCGAIRLLNAGHLPPLIVRHGEIEQLKSVAPALGIMPDAEFIEQHIELGPHETMIVYSDGLTEAQNRNGDFFGDDRFHRLILTMSSAGCADIGKQLLIEVDRFIGDAYPSDDLSLVILKRES
ncbi:MAG: PP2C family protein-serine/threonine phosphatase [Bacteroidota bacterium]